MKPKLHLLRKALVLPADLVGRLFADRPDVVIPPSDSPLVLLGDYVDPTTNRVCPLLIPLKDMRVHGLFSGLTRTGKSKLGTALMLQKIANGEQVILIDPHGAFADDILATMIETGAFDDAEMFDKVWFLDLKLAGAYGLYMAFDVLSQDLPPHVIAEAVLQVFKRLWPLETSAALDAFVLYGCLLLISNDLPITLLDELITDEVSRKKLIPKCRDRKAKSYFIHFDNLKWTKNEETRATFRRIVRLMFQPELRYSLTSSQPHNIANFREILASGRSVIFSIHFDTDLVTRLFGTLLMVMIEMASTSRLGTSSKDRVPTTIFVDEFPLFLRADQEDIGPNNFLQRTAGAGVSMWLCHQNLSSIPDAVKGALDNAKLRITFEVGPEDAREHAPHFFEVDPHLVKDTMYGQGTPRRTYYSTEEQRTGHQQAISSLQFREALVKLPDDRVFNIYTPDVPDSNVSPETLEAYKFHYFHMLFRRKEAIEQELDQRLLAAGVPNLGNDDNEQPPEPPTPPQPKSPRSPNQPPSRRNSTRPPTTKLNEADGTIITPDASLSPIAPEPQTPPQRPTDETDQSVFKGKRRRK